MRKSLPIFYSALLLTAVNLLLRFVSTSFQVFISARIGPEGVGLLQLVMSVGGLALTAGMAGIRTATMYLCAGELGRKKPENISWLLRGCFLYSLSFSTSIALLLHVSAPYLAHYWIGNSNTVDSIRIFARFLPIVCLCGCMTGYYTAANRIMTLAGIEILEQLIYMAVTMGALTFWAGSNAEKACEAIICGSGISSSITLLLLMVLRLRHRPQKGPRLTVGKPLMHTAIPLAIGDNVKSGINTLENLIVPKRLALFPGESAPLAAFGTVVGMVFPVLMFPAAILYALAELLIPELARCHASENSLRIRYLVRRCLRIAALYGFFCGGILYLCAELLCMRLYNSEMAGRYLKLYSLLAPILYCDTITDAMVKGLGQQTASVRYNIITTALDVALLFILLPKYGMIGYFISFFITHLMNFLLSLRRLLLISGVKLPFYAPAMLTAACLLSLFATASVVDVSLKLSAFILLFGCLLVLFRVISKGDFLWLKGLIKRN